MNDTSEAPSSYSNRFLKREAAEAYAQDEYRSDSYATAIWGMQIPLLKKTLKKLQQDNPEGSHFDFACGTGRITRLAEIFFDKVDALDISPAMVEVARKGNSKSNFFVGNILESPSLCLGPYASITSFRLLLNIDPLLRIPILSELKRRLQPNGVLIVNLHGNRQSLRHPAILWKRWRHRRDTDRNNLMLNAMTRTEVERCLEEAGFQVREVHGYGILPPTLYRLPFNFIWRALDRQLSRVNWLKRFCIDLIFVCRMNPTAQ